jgi:oligopeptidase A
MDGLFDLAKTLFGIEIEPADGLAPVIKFFVVQLFLYWGPSILTS